MATGDLVSQFIKDGVYLRGWSPWTIETYRFSLDAFSRSVDDAIPSERSSHHLRQSVASMRESGLTPGGCNLRIRSVNSYLTSARADTPERFRIKQLPNPAKPYLTFTEAALRRVITHVPKGRAHRRAWTLAGGTG